MILIGLTLFCISVIFAIAEAIWSRDWPREMFKFVVLFGAALLILFQAGG